MKKVLFATENDSKLKRFRDKLLEKDIILLSINDLDEKIELQENGKNAIENALIKARNYAKICDYPVFAMDDNLYIEDIPANLQPGVYVRRVNGKRLNDKEMIDYYSNLAKVYGNNGKLTARWVYGIAIVTKDKEYTYSWSRNDFYIIDKPCDKTDIGYPLNSISVDKKLNKYFAEMTQSDKEKVKEDDSSAVLFLCKKL